MNIICRMRICSTTPPPPSFLRAATSLAQLRAATFSTFGPPLPLLLRLHPSRATPPLLHLGCDPSPLADFRPAPSPLYTPPRCHLSHPRLLPATRFHPTPVRPGGQRTASSARRPLPKLAGELAFLFPPMAICSNSNSAASATITHVIFDMDGLLLDTEGYYTEVQEKILERFGKKFEWSLKAKMMGMKAIEAARVFVEETGISDRLSAEAFLVEREDMLRAMFPSSRLMPGAERLIKHLHSSGVPMSIATGSHQRHFDLKTQNHRELFGLMHHIVKGDDPEVKKGKPSPDIYLLAAKRFEGDVNSSSVLVFEDAPSGVAAAKNAGMWVVMVPDSRLDASYRQGADQVLDSLLDFQPGNWGLPLFQPDDDRSAGGD